MRPPTPGSAATSTRSARPWGSCREATGTIHNINLNRNTFQIQGSGTERDEYTWTASPTNTVGAKLSDLQEGDKVTIQYATDPGKQKQPINVMVLKKAE
jgi:hypothetical protein